MRDPLRLRERDDRHRPASRAAPAAVLDRLPDDRERQRGRGHRPGGVPALPPRAAAEVETSPKAYLSAVTTRLAIDHLRSARVRREEYVGPWLPEPLLTDEGAGDPSAAGRAGGLAVARLPRAARAAVARSSAPRSCCARCSATPTTRSREVVGKSEGNCRQLVARARRHVDARAPALRRRSRGRHEELTDRFIEATQSGDAEGLIALLAEDVVHLHRRRRQGAGAAAHGRTVASTSRASWSASPAPARR